MAERERETGLIVPEIRLVQRPGVPLDNNLLDINERHRISKKEYSRYKLNRLPSILISFYYLKGFLKDRKYYRIRNWVLDSGAFSAFNLGVEIKLNDYIRTCKKLLATDKQLVEIFSLDVIPHGKISYDKSWRMGLKNTEKMWKAGIEAIPVYHIGEPEDVLIGMARDYPKVGIGGVTRIRGNKAKEKFIGQCFSRIWPKKIHGLGVGSEFLIMKFPFHSMDATNWEIAPCAFGSWKKYGKISIRGSKQNLRSQVEWYLDLERKAQARWKKEMKLFENL